MNHDDTLNKEMYICENGMEFFIMCKKFYLQPVSILQNVKEDLTSEKLSKIVSGKAYLKLLRAFRNSGKASIEEVLTHKDSYNIV